MLPVQKTSQNLNDWFSHGFVLNVISSLFLSQAFVVPLTDESIDQSDSQRVFRASISDPESSGLFSSANGVLLLQVVSIALALRVADLELNLWSK
jgi:hypothetical protein